MALISLLNRLPAGCGLCQLLLLLHSTTLSFFPFYVGLILMCPVEVGNIAFVNYTFMVPSSVYDLSVVFLTKE